ncbi:hypothetical protein B296_00018144 [Ensete ventricosum]|uniref:Uncharacterized protein n=1 Tax=Ensete ventricosum TaxID=4639 RepID=A0A427A4Q1_ENSVE|nr:hypothetical protein B296_00018144 [Ensete ventricosum]
MRPCSMSIMTFLPSESTVAGAPGGAGWLRMHVRARQLPVFSSASVTGGRGKRGGSGAEVDCETAVNAYRNDSPSDSETSFVVFFYRVTPHDIKPLKAEKDAPVTVLADVLLKSKS